jgi:DNA-binding transcriptional ArsR family regulator
MPATAADTTPSASPGASAPETLEGAAELLKALASRARLAIVEQLSHADQCVHELVENTGLNQPLVSQHLRVLRSAGVVTGSRRGREIAYSLTDEHLAHIARDAIRHSQEIHR